MSANYYIGARETLIITIDMSSQNKLIPTSRPKHFGGKHCKKHSLYITID